MAKGGIYGSVLRGGIIDRRGDALWMKLLSEGTLDGDDKEADHGTCSSSNVKVFWG